MTSVTLLVIDAACLRNRPEGNTRTGPVKRKGLLTMVTELMLAAPPAPATAPNRVRASGRRPRTRLGRRVFGTRAKRLVFLDALARCGDPAVAARELGVSVFDAYRVRDADAEFAAQ